VPDHAYLQRQTCACVSACVPQALECRCAELEAGLASATMSKDKILKSHSPRRDSDDSHDRGSGVISDSDVTLTS
jgi:hypothetical protein